MMHGMEQAVDAGAGPQAEVNITLWLAAAVSALGGLLFGYDWVVIGGAKPFYEAYFRLTEPSQQAWAVSCALLGCLVGAIASGYISDRLGRRRGLLISALIFAVSSVGTGWASSMAIFVTWRVIGGVAIGLAAGLSPMYIAEIAPAAIRGKMVCLNQIAIVTGILAAQIVNLLIAEPVAPGATLADIAASWNGSTGWRCMFAAAAIPAVAFLAGCLLIPESPRWLVSRAQIDAAERALRRLGGPAYAAEAMQALRQSGPAQRDRGLAEIVGGARFRKALLVGVVLAVLQQWCGINVIFNYAQEIFASAGYAVSDMLFNIVITGVVNFVFALVALNTVERWGRRRLMLLGCAGLCVIYAALGGCYLLGWKGWPLLLLVVLAIACYSMTLAPVTWVALAEIFPQEARGLCMAVATAALWTACFLLTYSFPLINAGMGTGMTFWLYALICLGGLVFVWRQLPETRGMSLEDIERGWH